METLSTYPSPQLPATQHLLPTKPVGETQYIFSRSAESLKQSCAAKRVSAGQAH